MATPKSRVLDLLKLRCSIFNTTFNPTNQRLGNKILRQRLKGPNLAAYYPPRFNPITALRKAFPHEAFPDEKETDRVESNEMRKARGKGTPKKRTKEESKKLNKRRPKG